MNTSPRLPGSQLLNVLSLSKNATAIYVTGDIIIDYANDAMIAIWGKNNNILGKPMLQAIPELKGQPFVGILQDVLKTGITHVGEGVAAQLNINGILQTFYYDYEYRAIKDEQGNPYCILHTATDVTDRIVGRQAIALAQERQEALIKEQSLNEELAVTNEELLHLQKNLELLNTELEDRVLERTRALTESESRLRYMLQDAPIAIALLAGPKMIIEAANKKVLEAWGKTDEIIGKYLEDALPELRGQAFLQLLNHVFTSGEPYYGNEIKALLEQDGVIEEVYSNFVYYPLKHDDGTTASIVLIANVVTEQVLARKRLEQLLGEKTILENTLRENQQRLQSVLDTMAEGVGIVDINGHIVYTNPMAQRILGTSAADMEEVSVNRMPWETLHVDGSPLAEQDHPVAVMMATGMSVYDQEVAIQQKDRERFYISINAAPLTDGNGKVNGGIATFMDVTNRRKLMQQKDEFISVASHELKTPITTLKASLQLLDRMKEQPSAEMISRLITQSNKSLDKLSSLVTDLLDVNRITQGQLLIRKSQFCMADLLNDCCHHVRTAGKHQIIIQGDMQLQIIADEQQVDQVIINLVNNAVKYAPDSKEIFITVEKLADEIKVSVKDTGPGVPTEKLPHLFDRYYRADYSGIQFSGLGLGLYICAEIIRKHNGRIGVDSEINKGSTFWFTLPIDKAPAGF